MSGEIDYKARREMPNTADDIAALQLKLDRLSKCFFSDFMYDGASGVAPWTLATLASGNKYSSTSGAKHPGTVVYQSSVTANSGVAMRIGTAVIQLAGGESFTAIVKTGFSVLNGVVRRIGFHDTVDHTAPTDGVYFAIIDGVLSGRTRSNSAETVTATTFNVVANTWYRLRIVINNDGTVVTYSVYSDDADVVLWTDSVATNIPTTEGRTTGCADVCTHTTGNAGAELGTVDYMAACLPNTRMV